MIINSSWISMNYSRIVHEQNSWITHEKFMNFWKAVLEGNEENISNGPNSSADSKPTKCSSPLSLRSEALKRAFKDFREQNQNALNEEELKKRRNSGDSSSDSYSSVNSILSEEGSSSILSGGTSSAYAIYSQIKLPPLRYSGYLWRYRDAVLAETALIFCQNCGGTSAS